MAVRPALECKLAIGTNTCQYNRNISEISCLQVSKFKVRSGKKKIIYDAQETLTTLLIQSQLAQVKPDCSLHLQHMHQMFKNNTTAIIMIIIITVREK